MKGIKMKIFFRILSLIVVISFVSVLAQEPGITWSKFYRPSSTLGIETMAIAYDGHQLPNGDLISAGMSVNPFLMAYIVKTNSDGDTLWTKEYFKDVFNYGSFTGTDIERTNDGGYFIVGYGTRQATTGIWILRVDANGDSLWSAYYTGGNVDTAYVTRDMKITPDNGIIILGSLAGGITYDDDVFVMKYSPTGTLQWYKIFGSVDVIDMAISIENAIGGGYIFISQYDSSGFDQLKLTKINDAGEFEWSNIYMTPPEDADEWGEIRKTNDNHYIICGEDFGDFFLMKIEQSGAIVWYHTYGFGGYQESAMSVYQTSDNGYILCGNKYVFYDPDYILYVVKTDASGQEQWSKFIDYNTFGCKVEKIEQTNDGGYVMFGQARLQDGGMDHLLITKLGGTTDVETNPNIPKEFQLYQNYPNPFNPTTIISYQLPISSKVTLKIYDALGIELAVLVDEFKSAGTYNVQFTIHNAQLSSGIYFYKLIADEFVQTKKMLYLK
jgi:Secretion system C-terminal sorting domain